jgi:hypothetical protein
VDINIRGTTPAKPGCGRRKKEKAGGRWRWRYMTTIIRIRDKRTGRIEDRAFPDDDAAYNAYWKLSDEDNPDLDIELISTDEDEDDE